VPPPPPIPQPQPVPLKPTFATWELLAGAAFSGFQGALIAIALFSLVKNPIITLAISVVILSILIFAQTRRWLEKFDLLIIPGISLAVFLFMPFLRAGLTMQPVIIFAVTSALIAIAVATVFRLIYKLISAII
jgi:serine/threonine-protein kinase